jgi:hypothetical protein
VGKPVTDNRRRLKTEEHPPPAAFQLAVAYRRLKITTKIVEHLSSVLIT